MGIRSNPYNNPAVGAALESVASLFAPPRAADMYAYAHAASEQQKAKRLSELFSMATGPNFNQQNFDRAAVGAGLYNPSSSYYSVDQQIAAAAARNSADNQRMLDQERLQQQGANYRQTLQPITVGRDATTFLPAPAQKALGLGPMLEGQKSLQPGETVITSGGQTLQGAAPLMTLDQVKGREVDALRKSGVITDQQIIDATLNPGELEKVATPGGPIYSTRSNAIGKPVYDRATDAHIAGNYRAPNGAQGVAMVGPGGKLIDSQTGAVLPAGVQTFRAQSQGGSPDDALGTGFKNQVSDEMGRISDAEAAIAQIEDILAKDPNALGTGANLRQGWVNVQRGADSAAKVMLDQGIQKLRDEVAAGRIDQATLDRISTSDPNTPAAQMLLEMLASRMTALSDRGGKSTQQEAERIRNLLGLNRMFSGPDTFREGLSGAKRELDLMRRNRGVVAPGLVNQFPPAPAQAAPPAAPAPSGYRILNVR